MLYTTRDRRVVRGYLAALAVGDVGHLAVTYRVLGYTRYVDVAGWNPMAWGNIGVTVSPDSSLSHSFYRARLFVCPLSFDLVFSFSFLLPLPPPLPLP